MKHSYASALMLAAAMTLSAQQTVPEGVELSKFITENVPMGSTETKAFQLLPGATYQLSDTADFQLTNVALTGDAANRPTVVISGNGTFITQNGLQISDINFDMTHAPISTLVAMSENPDSAFTTESLGLKALSENVKDGYVCMNPISFTSCNFRNLPGSLFQSGTKDWALNVMTISNCMMQFNKQNGKAVISFEDAWSGVNGVKDLTIEKSTFYNTGSTKKARFIRYGNKNNARPFAIWGPDAKSNHTLDGCTFYATFSDDKFANNMPEVKDFTVTINNTILYDISRPDEWFSRSGKISYESNGNNMAWLAGNDGGTPQTMRKEVEEIAIIENPDFVGPVDRAWNLSEAFGGVNFRPLNAIAEARKIGDPRWFIAPSESGLTIPAGSEISEFVAGNVPDGIMVEMAIHLVPGAAYTLTGNADTKLSNVIFIGDADNRPIVTVTENGLFITQNGLQFSGINFDMTDAPVSTLVAMSENPDSAFTTESLGLKALSENVKDGYVCMNPISFTGCDFRNLPGSLLQSGTKDWALKTMTISDCVMQFNKQNVKAVISFEDAWSGVNGVKDLTIEKSTFYNTGSTKNARFIRYGNKNNARPFAIWGPEAKSNHVIDCCTFDATFSDNKFANNMPEVKDFIVTINNTILYDISRPDEWFSRSGKISCESDGNNIAWLAGNDGGNPQTIRKEVEEIAIIANPDFVGPVNKEWNFDADLGGVNFRPLNTTAEEKKIGDPRWFNATKMTHLTIPDGSEISTFVAENVPGGSMRKVFLDLEAGGNYTLTGKADTKLACVSFIGKDDNNRPTVTISGDGSFAPSNGINIKHINFDMTDAPVTSFIRLQTNPDSCFSTKALGMMNDSSTVVEGFIMETPIDVVSCNFRNMPNSFLSNDSAAWAVKYLEIKDCVVQFNKQKSDPVINFATPTRDGNWLHFGQVLDMDISGSTFYNTSGDIKVYFIRYINKKSAMPYLAFGAGTQSNHTFRNCTFYKTFTKGQFGNNLPESKNFIVTFDSSILYGISRPDKYKAELLGENNVVWDGGIDDDGNAQNLRPSITAISSVVADPEFAGATDLPFDLSDRYGGVSFNPLNAECRATGAGDPRWFDAPTAIENIGEDAVITDGPVEYFNLQGVRISNANLMPGIYIKRQGGKASKVYVK